MCSAALALCVLRIPLIEDNSTNSLKVGFVPCHKAQILYIGDFHSSQFVRCTEDIILASVCVLALFPFKRNERPFLVLGRFNVPRDWFSRCIHYNSPLLRFPLNTSKDSFVADYAEFSGSGKRYLCTDVVAGWLCSTSDSAKLPLRFISYRHPSVSRPLLWISIRFSLYYDIHNSLPLSTQGTR